jgi:DNA-binding XRE family transcriptional regulator
MMNCPLCFDPLTEEQCKVIVDELALSVEGRDIIRKALKDKRLKTKTPQMKNGESNILSNIIKYLTNLRVKQHITQATVAKEIGISEWTVHRWETRGKGPGVEICEKWANFLGTSLRIVLNEIEKLEDE